MNATINNLDYEIQQIDQDVLSLNAGINYALGPNLTVGLGAQYLERDFIQNVPHRKDDETTYGINFTYTWLRNLSVGFNVGQQERNSNLPGNDYEELRFSLNVLWAYNFGANPNQN